VGPLFPPIAGVPALPPCAVYTVVLLLAIRVFPPTPPGDDPPDPTVIVYCVPVVSFILCEI
jgi:hypothetical protein